MIYTILKYQKDYLNNKSIVYEDFLTLCDIYNIKVSARTKGHLKNADACIKLDSYTLPKKMRVSDTVLKLSEELYNTLLHDQESKEDKINDLLTSEVAAETNINDLYSVTYENDDKKKDIIANNNLNEVNMNIQLLAAEVNQSNLKPIYNDLIEGHKEYQYEQLELYKSNTLNFQKKRKTNRMIEDNTKYFIYDNDRFMAVKPSYGGIYPSAYYSHVKQYDSLVDFDNKIILFKDKKNMDILE